jgi:hypothetical protein
VLGFDRLIVRTILLIEVPAVVVAAPGFGEIRVMALP